MAEPRETAPAWFFGVLFLEILCATAMMMSVLYVKFIIVKSLVVRIRRCGRDLCCALSLGIGSPE